MSVKFSSPEKEYSFEARYLGSAPTTSTSDKVVEQAYSLLRIKLEKLQARAVQATAVRKYGPLPPSSPKWHSVARSLRKKGEDVTRGDPVKIKMGKLFFRLRPRNDPEANWTRFAAYKVKAFKLIQSNKGPVVAFIYQSKSCHCHVLAVDPKTAQNFYESLQESVVLSTAEHLTGLEAKANEAARRESIDTNTGDITPRQKKKSILDTVIDKSVEKKKKNENEIVLGVGLKRHSSLRVSARGGRRETVSLTGARKAGVKRASYTYGDTFLDLGAEVSETADHDDDDDLDTLDESLFLVEDEVDLETEFETSDSGAADIEMENFGFHETWETFGFGEQQFGFDVES